MKAASDDRDEDVDGPVGFYGQAQRKRGFAADMALQFHALPMAAEGAVPRGSSSLPFWTARPQPGRLPAGLKGGEDIESAVGRSTLIVGAFVQAGLGLNVLARLLDAADLDMFRTCKSSMQTIAWFWLMALVALCR